MKCVPHKMFTYSNSENENSTTTANSPLYWYLLPCSLSFICVCVSVCGVECTRSTPMEPHLFHSAAVNFDVGRAKSTEHQQQHTHIIHCELHAGM
ncbi:hypothetical protein M5D96_001235 [Drosophila gunungcola]|uniref:Uncharacterized protein n=1 Tax=Drosophila gunungcola TaxID=103775 RepID=A0A9P9YY97_9MUSC|nr:hypothetical protein M5D96_001235 [Drosophila gunungcola]